MEDYLLKTVLSDDNYVSEESEYAFPLVHRENGSIAIWHLDSIPHMLIAGATGSGKTNFVKTLLLSLCTNCDENSVRFNLQAKKHKIPRSHDQKAQTNQRILRSQLTFRHFPFRILLM